MKKKIGFIVALLIILLFGGFVIIKQSIPSKSYSALATFIASSKKSKKLNTTLQIVPKFGECYFIPERDEVGTWYFISPKNKKFTIDQMRDQCPPSFGAVADSEGGLWIYNIDSYLDGWKVVCKFKDGSSTQKGKIQIDYSLPAEAPIMHPSTPATPIPEPTETIPLNTNVQVVPEYGQCYFYTDRDDENVWYFISPDGDRFTIEAMRKKCPAAFGAKPDAEGGLWLYNIGKWIDGWSVMCIYPDGVVSEPGTIQIDYSLPAEAIIMHPM